MFPQFILILCSLLIFSSSLLARENTQQDKIWQALGSGNHFAIIRHALAPGMGDPANFTLGQRETQRNLSEEGRQQARYIGKLFRQHGIQAAQVFSSQWFRCLDTAELLDLGSVTPLPALNSFFRNFAKEAETTQALNDWLTQQEMDKPLVLVTHQVNITALTGVYPSSGEIVVVAKQANGKLRVVGTIKTD